GRGLSRLEDGWWLGRGGVGARWLLRRVEGLPGLLLRGVKGLPGLLLRGVKGLAGLLRRIEGWRRPPRLLRGGVLVRLSQPWSPSAVSVPANHASSDPDPTGAEVNAAARRAR